MYQLTLNNGKYTIYLNDSSDNDRFVFKCERYKEPWRNLTGDNLMLSLVYRVQELEEKLNEIENCLVCGAIADPMEIVENCLKMINK